MVSLRPQRHESLNEILERILDKGIVIGTKIRVAFGEVDLVEIDGTIILASFRTAARIGLDFPDDTNFETKAWRRLIVQEECPQCKKLLERKELKEGCPWCGFRTGG